MRSRWLLVAVACVGCGVEAAPPPRPPTANVPSASAPDRQPPTPPAAPAVPAAPAAADPACTSVLHGPIAAHSVGSAISIEPGERLCVQIEHESERITSARVVETSSEPDRTLVLSLTGVTLQIENPFDDLLLHYSLDPLPVSGRVCPAHPHETHTETLPQGTAKVTLSGLHFKGHGTAGSELCM